MRPENFQTDGTICLHHADQDLDLHNDYNFVGLSYDVGERAVELQWRRSTGDWVQDGLPAALRLACRGVTHFSATPRDPEMPFTEDDCLSDLSFALPREPDDAAFSLSPATAGFDGSWHWVFSFMSGFSVRVAAESAHLSTNVA